MQQPEVPANDPRNGGDRLAWRRCASLKSTSAGTELLLSSMPASSPDLPQVISIVRKGIVQRTVGLAPDG